MSPEALELAQRLAVHPRWNRKIGMVLRAVNGRGEVGERRYVVEGPQVRQVVPALVSFVPDLTEDATAGVLLEMLAEACTKGASVEWSVKDREWDVDPWCHAATGHWNTSSLGEGLAQALLNVWGSL